MTIPEMDEDLAYERFKEAQIDAYCDQHADYDSDSREIPTAEEYEEDLAYFMGLDAYDYEERT